MASNNTPNNHKLLSSFIEWDPDVPQNHRSGGIEGDSDLGPNSNSHPGRSPLEDFIKGPFETVLFPSTPPSAYNSPPLIKPVPSLTLRRIEPTSEPGQQCNPYPATAVAVESETWGSVTSEDGEILKGPDQSRDTESGIGEFDWQSFFEDAGLPRQPRVTSDHFRNEMDMRTGENSTFSSYLAASLNSRVASAGAAGTIGEVNLESVSNSSTSSTIDLGNGTETGSFNDTFEFGNGDEDGGFRELEDKTPKGFISRQELLRIENLEEIQEIESSENSKIMVPGLPHNLPEPSTPSPTRISESRLKSKTPSSDQRASTLNSKVSINLKGSRQARTIVMTEGQISNLEKRRAQNRAAQKTLRIKKNNYVHQLERRKEELKKEGEELETVLQSLREENEAVISKIPFLARQLNHPNDGHFCNEMLVATETLGNRAYQGASLKNASNED